MEGRARGPPAGRKAFAKPACAGPRSVGGRVGEAAKREEEAAAGRIRKRARGERLRCGGDRESRCYLGIKDNHFFPW